MPKIPRALVLEREKQVWHMRQRGATYERIAEELGITFGGVSKILQRLHQRYKDRHMDDIEACRMEQIGELQNIANEAWEAWIRSKGQKITIKKRARTKDGKMLPGEASEVKYESEGDTKYLQIYLKAKEDLRKIIGADAPTKNDHTGKNGEPIKVQSVVEEQAESKVKNFMAKLFAKSENKDKPAEDDDS